MRERVTYSPKKQNHKFYFGGFLNLANNNIQEVFSELFKRFPLRKKEGKLSKPKVFLETIFNDEISILDYERWVKIIGDYFPVVHYIDKKHCENRRKRVKYFRETFVQLLETTENLRHYYTHYYHENLTINEKIELFLDDTLEAVAYTIKKKQDKRDHTKEFLRKSVENELNQLKNIKREELQGKAKKLTDEDIVNEIFNDALEPYFNKSKKQDISNSKEEILFTKRLLFLLSMFLTKAEIENCKANIKGYKETVLSSKNVPTLKKNSIVFMTTHRVFSFLAYKGLKRKIRTSTINHVDEESPKINFYNKETLVLQMIDELSKVPDVIYQNLSEDKQNSFVEDLNEYLKENVDNLEQARVIHPIIRKRYEDKFNYFALRFLDEYANFPTLRFQIYLGDYLHDEREKNLKGGIIDREIKEKINVFGRLSEIEKAKADYWEQNTENTELGWRMFPNPSYNFPKENISDTDGYYDSINLER